MYEAPGIGLAATQVDVHEQVIVIDISETRDELLRPHGFKDLGKADRNLQEMAEDPRAREVLAESELEQLLDLRRMIQPEGE